MRGTKPTSLTLRVMMKILIVLGITLLFTSLACGTESSKSEPLVNTETTTEKAQNSDETDTTSNEEVVKDNSKSLDRTLGGLSDEEVVIAFIKDRLENETECGFLLEETDWTTEYSKMKKLWVVSVALTDDEGGGSYSWKYFAMDEEVISEQDECHLSGSTDKWAGSALPNQQPEED
jgi:hypothetical protein